MNTNEVRLLGLVPMRWLAPRVMFLMAVAAVIASGMSTYDLAYILSPLATAAIIGAMTVVVIDGGFLLLDLVFPYVKTSTARSMVAVLMSFLWAAMAGTNITDAILNLRVDTAALGWGEWIMYGVKVVGLVYLAMYAFIRFDDPETRRILQETEIAEIKNREVLMREREYSQKMAVPLARALAIRNIQERFKRETGRNIEEVIGSDWVRLYLAEIMDTPITPQPKNGGRKAAAVPVPVPGILEKFSGKLLQFAGKSPNPTGPQA